VVGLQKEANHSAVRRGVDITIYGTPTCSACRGLKRVLKKRGIVFAYEDLDGQNTLRLAEAGFRTVPVVEANGALMTGEEFLDHMEGNGN